MRIAIGGFCHETNSLGKNLVDKEMLIANELTGNKLISGSIGSWSYNKGFLDEADALGVEVVPTAYYFLRPSGPCSREAVELARDKIVGLLWAEYEKQPYDAIVLFMHGAGTAEGFPDIEGAILEAIREKMGLQIPIGTALDLHGNISDKMMELADFLVGCKHYPHIDEYDTGRLVFQQVHRMVQKGIRPFKSLVRLPWLMVPAQGVTTSGAARDVLKFCLRLEEENKDRLYTSFFQGFPYSDVKDACVSVVTMAETKECAEENAWKIARYAWQHRSDFAVPLHSAKEAVDLALIQHEFPVIIHEGADNPGGGAPGNGTHLLRELLSRNVPSAFGFIWDPEVAMQAAKAGVGARISCRLGGKTDRFSGEPIDLTDAYVKTISDGKTIRKNPMGKGSELDMGTLVCLIVGNVSIVVASVRMQTYDDGPFVLAGIDWREQKILAMKSAQHFKAWWSERVKEIISCDPPGTQSANISGLPLRNIDRSYYPLCPDRKFN